MEAKRKYVEKLHFPKKDGGGSFYEWYDVEVKNEAITISHLHAAVHNNSKKLPTDGSGSEFTLTKKQAKILVPMLNDALKKL